MIVTKTMLNGVHILEIERLNDERGFFARTWCKQEFANYGLNSNLAQCSISFNHKRGTLRGMHYQIAPYGESKLVRCTAGAIYDVVIDLRRDSATFCKWLAVELSAENRCMLYVPEDFAHGFQTLKDNTEVLYQISVPHAPAYAQGVRWDDPAFDIRWPTADRVVSTKDASYPNFTTSEK